MQQRIVDLARQHAWWALAALLIGLLAMAAKKPQFFGGPLARVPVKHRAKVVAGLGVISGVLDAIVRGTPIADAVLHGLMSAAAAVLFHGVVGGVNPTAAAGEAKGELPVPAEGAAPIQGLPGPDTLPAPPPPVTPFTAVAPAGSGEPWPPRADLDFSTDPKPGAGQ